MNRPGLFRLRFAVVALALLVLGLALSFNALLSISTLDRMVIQSVLSGYQGAGEHLALGIERGLRFGKPLDQYAGMVERMQGVQDRLHGVVGVSIVDTEGQVLYATGRVVGQGREAALSGVSDRRAQFDRQTLSQHVHGLHSAEPAQLAQLAQEGMVFMEAAGAYHVVIPLHFDAPGTRASTGQAAGGHAGMAVVGGVGLDVSRDVVDAATRGFVRWIMLLLVAACVLAGMLLAAWIGLLTATPEARGQLHRTLGRALVVLVGGTQLAYSGATLMLFGSFLEQAVHTKATVVAQAVQGDFEYLVHKGVRVTTLKGGEMLMHTLVDRHPELQGAELSTPGGEMVAGAGIMEGAGSVLETPVEAYWPSRYRQRLEVMRIRFALAPAAVRGPMAGLGIDLATSLVISLLFLMELARLLGLVALRVRCAAAVMGDQCHGGEEEAHPSYVAPMLRAAGFLFFLGYDMGISFIPLLARKLYVPMWGLSREVLTGLPISAEMVCAGVALLLAGMIASRFGWRWAFVLGALCAATGLGVAGWSTSLPMLILSRGIAGFGFGMMLMTAQIGTLGNTDMGSGIAGVFAGIFAGSICGAAAGAMLADRLGYDAVFMIAALIIPLALLVLPLGGRRSDDAAVSQDDAVPGSGWAFVRDPHMHCLLLCVGIPSSICLTGFLYYLMPIMLSNAEVSQSTIGRLFMLYGLCFITVGPPLGRLVDRMPDKSAFAALTGLLSGGSLVVAALFTSVLGAGAAVGIIGVAQCLAAPATMLCVIGLQSARRQGRAKTASVYRSLERIGQVLGPILVGVVLAALGVKTALLAMGAVVCGLAVLFLVVWKLSTRKGWSVP